MSIGLVGRKSGMTRIFKEDGVAVPVTVIHVEPNTITQVKTEQRDGYDAIQVTAGAAKGSTLSAAQCGHFRSANVAPGRGLWEFRLKSADDEFQVGKTLSLSMFVEGQKVDVSSVSKGKGFAGVIKRWNFSMQDATHGNSLSHRAPGSIGQNQSPGRVFKGKKMAGHLGCNKVTIQSLVVVRVDLDRNVLLIKGAIPGATGADVMIRHAEKC